MMSNTLGAPFGGTTRGAHHGVDSEALSLIIPPNFGSGGGSCLPVMVVVASGEPGVPVACCAMTADATGAMRMRERKAIDTQKGVGVLTSGELRCIIAATFPNVRGANQSSARPCKHADGQPLNWHKPLNQRDKDPMDRVPRPKDPYAKNSW